MTRRARNLSARNRKMKGSPGWLPFRSAGDARDFSANARFLRRATTPPQLGSVSFPASELHADAGWPTAANSRRSMCPHALSELAFLRSG